MRASENISDSHLWLVGSVCKRHQQTASVHSEGLLGKRRHWDNLPVAAGPGHFQTCSQSPSWCHEAYIPPAWLVFWPDLLHLALNTISMRQLGTGNYSPMFHQQGFMCYSFAWTAGRWPCNDWWSLPLYTGSRFSPWWNSAVHYLQTSSSKAQIWALKPYELPNQGDVLRNYSWLIITL